MSSLLPMMLQKIGARLAGEGVECFRDGRVAPSVRDYLRHIWTVLRVLETIFAHYYASKG